MPWVRLHAWRGVLLVGCAAVVIDLAAAVGPSWLVVSEGVRAGTSVIVGAVTVAAVIAAAASGRLPGRPGWLLLTGGLLVALLGNAALPDAASSGRQQLAVLTALVAAAAMFSGVLVLTGRLAKPREPAASVDALVVTATAGLAIWVLAEHHSLDLTRPTGIAGALGWLWVLVPVLDLALLAAVARLWFTVGRSPRPPATLLGAGLLAAVAGGALTAASLRAGRGSIEPWLDAAWVASCSLVAAAAVHPSWVQSPADKVPAEHPEDRRVMGLLALVVVVPLLLLVVAGAWSNSSDPVLIVWGALGLLSLLLVRLDGLVRRHRSALQREQVMRETGSSLAAAADLAAIRSLALRAARALVPASDAWLVAPTSEPNSARPAVIVAAHRSSSIGTAMSGEAVDLLDTAADHRIVLDEPTLLHRLLDCGDTDVLTAFRLTAGPRGQGFLVLASPGRPCGPTLAALASMAQTVAMASVRFDLARAQAERRLERRVRRMLQHANDVIAVLDPDLRLRYVTPAAERLLGTQTGVLLGSSWLSLVLPADRSVAEALTGAAESGRPARGEIRLAGADGKAHDVDVVATRVVDEEDPGYVLTCHDVTHRRALEQQLTHQAFHDTLTGLPNRALFTDRLEQALARSRRSGQAFAVLFVDLDDFKNVNDQLGHAAGDMLLRQVTARLLEVLRDQDTAARLGGDEFALLLQDVQSEADATAVAARLISTMGHPFEVDGAPLTSSVSVGVAVSGSATADADEIMRNADLALYRAKNQGKDRYALFVPVMHERAIEELALTGELRTALDAHALVVYYQPIVQLKTNQVLGVEALVRWPHPERGLLTPDQFVPLAERSGLVLPLGRNALREALAAVAGWQSSLEGHRHLQVAVNVSARQLEDEDFVADVRTALALSGVDPATVVLEITEGVLLPGRRVTTERLRALRELGVGLFIDDFGTGYSSLSVLQDLPVDGIKLGREFVAPLTHPDSWPNDPSASSSAGLVSTIRSLAESLGLAAPIAEGIETASQREALLALGYRVGQGFLLGRPMPAEDVAHLLSASPAPVGPHPSPVG